MKSSNIFKLFFCIVVFIMIGGYGNKGRCNEASGTATVKFVVILNDGTLPENQETANFRKDEGCFLLNALGLFNFTTGESSPDNSSDAPSDCGVEDVVDVKMTISGPGLDTPMIVILTQSVPGDPYTFTGTQLNLPTGVELTFKGEGKNASGKIIFQGSTNATLESGKKVTIKITLASVCMSSVNFLPIVGLKIENNQIESGGTVAIEIYIRDDDDEKVTCEISHSSSKGSLSNTGGLITLENNKANIETILTADISGGYSDEVMVKVNDMKGGTARVSVVIDVLSDDSAPPPGNVDTNIFFPPVIESISVEYNTDATMTITALINGETTNLTYTWEGDIVIIGVENSNPIVIEQPPYYRPVVLTVTNEIGISSECTFYISSNAEPSISFTHVPAFGDSKDHCLKGVVHGVNPKEYGVTVYIKLDKGWKLMPCSGKYWQLTIIKLDMSWECDIIYNSGDEDATHIVAFLVPIDWTQFSPDGYFDIPQELYDSTIAHTSIERETNYKAISFSGYEWTARTYRLGNSSGPNNPIYSDESTWIDEQGYLHLRIIKRDDEWYYPQIICEESLGHGGYVLYLGSRIDQLVKDVTFHFFIWNYDSSGDYQNVGIRWCDSIRNDERNTEYIYRGAGWLQGGHTFKTLLTSNDSVHFFEWQSDYSAFKSIDGHDLNGTEIESFTFGMIDYPPTGREKLRINLFGSYQLEQEAEVIIKKFEFVP